jgi:hypothetical protein
MQAFDNASYLMHLNEYIKTLNRKMPINKGWKIKRVQNDGKVFHIEYIHIQTLICLHILGCSDATL